jgi:N-acetylmuramoyl-L-alanine amidase
LKVKGRPLVLLLLLLGSHWILGQQASMTVKGNLPTGSQALVWFKPNEGIMVQGRAVPKGFLKPGVAIETWIDYRDLNSDGKRWALLVLFPRDEWRENQVIHQVVYPKLETVWLISTFFTGHGQNYDELMSINPRLPEKVRVGDRWVIPRQLLAKELGGLKIRPNRSRPEDSLDDEAKIEAYRKLLTYELNNDEKYAVYHLRKGEAIYSDVVLRYTDRVYPLEVNALSLLIAKKSGIRDVRSIKPGQSLLIPIDYLASPFQPEGSLALKDEKQIRDEIKRTESLSASPNLKGVEIILDAGHGGIDPGASANGLWESDFVYDIANRVRSQLLKETEATVKNTISYPSIRNSIRSRIKRISPSAEILTTPPYRNDGENPSSVGVHLRWILSNSWTSKFISNKGDDKKTLFISFHADSLHPSASGTMVYVPGSSGVPDRFQIRGLKGVQVNELPKYGSVTFTPQERFLGEVRSRQFSEILIKNLAQNQLPIHQNRAIRNIIQREGTAFVPAVIRYNKSSTKVLIEVANLNNPVDAENLSDPEFRSRFAESVCQAIKAYFKN